MPDCCVIQGRLKSPAPFGSCWDLLIVCKFHGRTMCGPCSFCGGCRSLYAAIMMLRFFSLVSPGVAAGH